jgi:hypothetical protein
MNKQKPAKISIAGMSMKFTEAVEHSDGDPRFPHGSTTTSRPGTIPEELEGLSVEGPLIS